MSGQSKIVVWLERFAGLFIATGVSFKLFHWPGASVLVVFGGLVFIVGVLLKTYLNFFVSQRTTKEKLANFITTFSGVAFATAIIFKQQHYPFADFIFYLGSLSLVIAVGLTNWKLNLQKRHIVISAVFIFWVLIGFIFSLKHEQFKQEISAQIIDLRKASISHIDSPIEDSTKAKAIKVFYSTVDEEIYNVLKLYNSNRDLNFDSIYPLNIPFPASDLFDDLVWGTQGIINISNSYQNIGTRSEFDDFSIKLINASGLDTLNARNKELDKSEKIEVPKVFTNTFFNESFIFYSWYLESLKLNLATFFIKSQKESDLVKLTKISNDKLFESTKAFFKRQNQLLDSLILVTLLLIITLYLDRVGLKQRYQKPLVFFAVFAFLEFILLIADPVIQLYIENGYLVSALELGLAALVIPFHSMVEHNLYQKNEHDS